MKATPDQQRQLLDLQHLDDQLVRVKAQMEALGQDEQLTKLRRGGSLAVQQAKAAQAEVQQHQAALQEAERLVAETTNRRNGMQSKMDADQVPTRDVHAVTLEIAELTLRIETLEDAQLDAIQTLEAAQKAGELAQAQIAEAEQAVNVRITTLNEQGQQLSKQSKELSAERSLMAQALPADVVTEYEQLRELNQGTGVLELTPQAISGAGVPIAPAELAAIQRTPADELAYCPDTGAILART